MPSEGNSREFWEGSSPDENAVDVFTRRFGHAKTDEFPPVPDLGILERLERIERKVDRGFLRFEVVSVRFAFASFFVGVFSGMVILAHQ